MKKSDCFFCNDIGEERIIMEGNDWIAFIPLDPEIFGHCIVTTKHHYEDITEIDGKEALDKMSMGVKVMADKIKSLDDNRIKKVYFAVLGETERTHMHYHLFPRYEGKEELIQLTSEDIKWRNFYNNSTKDFEFSTGFQYLGEIEKNYENMKESIGRGPSLELLKEMVNIIRGDKND